MVKKFSAVALAGLLAVPAMALAQPADQLEKRIDALTKELTALKAQMDEMKEENEKITEEIDEKAEKWDAASRFELSGDIRSRLDMHWGETAESYLATNVANGIDWFINPGSAITPDGVTPTATAHTVAGSQGSLFGTAGLLYGFFLQDPTSPTAGNPAQSAGGAAQALSNVLYGTTDNVTIAVDGVGNITAVNNNVNGLAALSHIQRAENLTDLMRSFTAAQRVSLFTSMGYGTTAAKDYEEDNGLWSTRLRLNMRAKATENVEFKGRIVGYKAWGIQHNPMPEGDDANGSFEGTGVDSPYFLNSRTFDGTVGRKPEDSDLVLDRAFMNWNNIGGQPIWFSIGRRPTTDGPPAHLRMGADERLATPVAFMDYPFDGISVGYAYKDLFGLTGAPGRIRFCYGRGFEAGPAEDDTAINDVDFMGLSWDIYQKGNRFANIQSFLAANLFNVPGDTFFPNPLEAAFNTGNDNGILDRTNLGNVLHTSGVYMDKFSDLNYFLALGWSHTDPNGMDELGNSLLSDFWETPEKKDGYAVYFGGRYDIPNTAFKIGAEYNYGSKNWLGFTPGSDDQYTSKLYTRGSVYEVYGIWDIPAGEAISKFGSAFIRVGYQHYDVEYTYSGMWLGTPTDIDEIKNDPLEAQFYPHFDEIDQIYVTLEAWF